MTEHGAAGHWDEQDVTSLAEEIRLLVELVVDRAAPWLDGVIAAGHGTAGAERPDDTGPGCDWCPLCAIVAVVRGERPEFAARLLEQAAALVALLRAVLADRWQPQEGVHMPGYRPAPRPEDVRAEDPVRADASSATAPRVQRIEVRRRAQWQPGQGNGQR
ncbi:hypothetical protein SAMN05216266_112200 [Amycolatopsis marina]|uniref:Uncharacterized protein n=1 Tax=Amycolatopsis marina TaxID=490629 RepID=A0A1I1B846_9PSEU|nr:hypothetical protein [Amycolatopsis marina]SFB46534.1 hypothetical protein SAMN05216266_112200 [Amycolatopsis marina]